MKILNTLTLPALPAFTYANTCEKTPLKIHLIFVGNNDIYCIFKTCCIICVLFSTKCYLYHNFNIFCSNKTQVFVKCAIKFKYQFICLKVKELLQSLLYSLCIDMFPLKHHHISNKIVVYWFINYWNMLCLIHVCTKQINFVCSSRYFHWNLVLYMMLFMVIVLIPFYIGYFIVSNIRFGKCVCI